MIPYVKWYPSDWLASKAARVLTFEQQGIYRALLDIAWQNCCRDEMPPTLDPDPGELALELGMDPMDFKAQWSAVCRFWIEGEDGRLFNPRQMEEYEAAMEMIEKRRKAGKTGGKGRPKHKQKTAHAKQVLAHANKSQASVSYPDSDSEPEKREVNLEKIPTGGGDIHNARESAVLQGEARAVLENLKASDKGKARPRSEPQPIGGMLGGRPKLEGKPINGESLANWILAAWKQNINGDCRGPTIRDAEQIADVLMRDGPRSSIHEAGARMVALLADETAEKRLKDPLSYLFGVLSKGGLPRWLEKETKAERKDREAKELKAAVEEGQRMAREGRR